MGLEAQTEKLAIQRRYTSNMREIGAAAAFGAAAADGRRLKFARTLRCAPVTISCCYAARRRGAGRTWGLVTRSHQEATREELMKTAHRAVGR